MASTTREILDGVLSPLTITDDKFDIYFEKWANLLYEAANIKEEDIMTDSAWPYLFRLFMAYLILRDLILDSVNRRVLGNDNGASIGVGTSTSSSGPIKKIETGPVNVERYDANDSAAALYAQVFNRNGLWEDVLSQICTLARRLGVFVNGCKGATPGPIMVIRGSDYSYENQYPETPTSQPRPL